MLGEHKETDVDGVSYYDVRGIRRVLMNELGSQQGALMSGQLTLILEVRCVCRRLCLCTVSLLVLQVLLYPCIFVSVTSLTVSLYLC